MPPNVKTYETIKDIKGYNITQLIYACSSNLKVSVQGGGSILASLGGGTNIILAKKGQELKCNAYNNWYHKLGNT